MAGPLVRLSMRNWIALASMPRAISPPRASISRTICPLATPSTLEEYVFAKPYFDPAGLLLALEDGVPVGFAHGGFGPGADESALSTGTGVVCAVGVRPSHRRRGLGAELLRRCEAYLAG